MVISSLVKRRVIPEYWITRGYGLIEDDHELCITFNGKPIETGRFTAYAEIKNIEAILVQHWGELNNGVEYEG